LVVEDDRRIATFLLKGLQAGGYDAVHAGTGSEALAAAEDEQVRLILLDLGLPDMDGTEVLLRLRESGNRLPVLVLTARCDVMDRVESLDLGADDYLAKPFAFPELLARVRARLRRDASNAPAVLHCDGIELDVRSRRALVLGREVDLTARELTLLETFMRHTGEVITRDELLSNVWGIDFDPGTNVVDVYVRYLRRKLGDGFIETVRGVGYRFKTSAVPGRLG